MSSQSIRLPEDAKSDTTFEDTKPDADEQEVDISEQKQDWQPSGLPCWLLIVFGLQIEQWIPFVLLLQGH